MNIHHSTDCNITGFEGPEKRLEVNFKRQGVYEGGQGLRAISKDTWQEMLNFARCTIISHMKNDEFDAYVLSESSLFVYPRKVVIKTCGQITLLLCVEYLVKLGLEFCGSSVSYVNFARRNLFYPDKQPLPHTSWEDETAFLKNHFPEGDGFVFGPRSCDHHYVFVADYQKLNPYFNSFPRSYCSQNLEVDKIC